MYVLDRLAKTRYCNVVVPPPLSSSAGVSHSARARALPPASRPLGSDDKNAVMSRRPTGPMKEQNTDLNRSSRAHTAHCAHLRARAAGDDDRN